MSIGVPLVFWALPRDSESLSQPIAMRFRPDFHYLLATLGQFKGAGERIVRVSFVAEVIGIEAIRRTVWL
jgi:hypothetical protein